MQMMTSADFGLLLFDVNVLAFLACASMGVSPSSVLGHSACARPRGMELGPALLPVSGLSSPASFFLYRVLRYFDDYAVMPCVRCVWTSSPNNARGDHFSRSPRLAFGGSSGPSVYRQLLSLEDSLVDERLLSASVIDDFSSEPLGEAPSGG